MASPLPSTSSVPDAQQRFWDTAEMNLAVYSHVKRDRDARSLAATSLSLRCWQHPRIPKHMSLPGDFPKFSRDPEVRTVIFTQPLSYPLCLFRSTVKPGLPS